ncbi:MAG: aldolase/citrate lyase family protein [Pseudomonadota bacterium]
MRPNQIRERWNAGKPVVSAWLSIGNTYLAEAVGHTGYHCVNVDLQHGMFDTDTAILMLQAISSTPATPIVRVPSSEATTIMKVLDAGSYGIICPMVDTADEAADFVAATRYPPLGMRSFGPSRGLLYGGPDYFDNANDTIVRLAMIETREGLDNVEAICAVDGLDGVFIGPNDLGLALDRGPAVDPTEPDVVAAIDRILAAAQSNQKHAGIFCPSGKVAQRRIADGFDFVVPNTDVNLLRRGIAGEFGDIGNMD